MNTQHPKLRFRGGKKSGQIIVIYGLLCPLLFLFIGLGIDTGLMYLTKARLSRAVDAVALRLARKFTSDQDERKNMALTIMRANFPEFLKNSTVGSFSSSGTLAGSAGETMTATEGGQKLTITTMSNTATAVVTVKVSAEADHNTFFMPLANVDKAHFTDSATAERFPACNILILDNSGSMEDNDGDIYMAPAVNAFLDEFDEDRDYLLMISFNYVPYVIWPPPGEGIVNGRVRPARKFLSGTGFSKSAKTAANDMTFANSTNAACGVRLAGYNVDEWYNTLTPLEKSKIKFNYVFMTDGEFNAAPTYVRGYGFGYSDYRYLTSTLSDSPVGNRLGTGKGTTMTYSALPPATQKSHYFLPVFGGEGDTPFQVNNADVVFKWYQSNGTLRNSFNLRDIFESPDNLDLGTTTPTPCVQANIYGAPGKDTLFVPFTVLAASEIPSESGTSNNTVTKFSNYSTGKKWNATWSGSTAKLSYYYPEFTHPKEIVYPSKKNDGNTYNSDGVLGGNYWNEWYSFAEQAWKTNSVADGTSTNDYSNWCALAQVSYLRKAHSATFYSVGFAAANEEIMRNIANQKSDGTSLEATDARGKYYRVTSATGLTTTFRDIARQIAVRLSE